MTRNDTQNEQKENERKNFNPLSALITIVWKFLQSSE